MNTPATFLMTALLLFSISLESVAEINIGIFPRWKIPLTMSIYKPLADLLSEELGEKVSIKVSKDFRQFWSRVQTEKYDIIHVNQYQYLLANKQLGYRVFAVNEESGSILAAGALVVRNDSDIHSLQDMRGRTILFGGGKKAMVSYISTTYLLKKAGLTENVDYTANFGRNPQTTLFSVYKKLQDVAGTGLKVLQLEAIKKKLDVSQLKIIAKSENFIHLPWAASPGFSDTKLAKIQHIMAHLKSDNPAILASSKVTNFIQATDTDFDKVREIVHYVTGENFQSN